MRAYEFITEASYDQMIMTMQAEYPDQQQLIGDNLKWAKSNLKKEDRVVWFMKIVRDQLQNNPQSLGNYQFQSWEQLQHDILHFFGYQSEQIQNYLFKNQTVSQAIDDLSKLEQDYITKQAKEGPVPVQSGDYKLIEFKDGTVWWFIDRAFCPEEGRSGAHCGNIEGQAEKNKDQRILSLRKPGEFKIKKDEVESGGHVILTFILHPDGKLGEMKAKGNQKPQPKFHPHIMSLLLNPMIKGISGGGYLRATNFSIFDLNDKNLKTIEQLKPSLIPDQIIAEPIDFMKAPDWIKENQEYRKLAITKLPGLQHVLNNDWESAIKTNNELVIHSPNALTERYDQLYSAIKNNPALLLKSPNEIRFNFELVRSLLMQDKKYPPLFSYVTPNTPRYAELCADAVLGNARAFDMVPAEFKSEEVWKNAISRNASLIRNIPDEFNKQEVWDIAMEKEPHYIMKAPDKFVDKKRWDTAVANDPYIIKDAPKEYIDQKLWNNAVSKHPHTVIDKIPEQFNTQELWDIIISVDPLLILKAPSEFVDEKRWKAAVYKQTALIDKIPEQFQTADLWKIVVADRPGYIEKVPAQFMDWKIWDIAVSSYPKFIMDAPESVVNKDLWYTAISNYPPLLDQVPDEFLPANINMREIWNNAVSNHPELIHEVPDKFKGAKIFKLALNSATDAFTKMDILDMIPDELKQKYPEFNIDPFSFMA